MSLSLQAVSGIGAQTAEKLAEHGFQNAQDLAQANVEQVSAVPGFGASRAAKVIAAAQAAVIEVGTELEAANAASAAEVTSEEAKLKGAEPAPAAEQQAEIGGMSDMQKAAQLQFKADRKRKKLANKLQRKARQMQKLNGKKKNGKKKKGKKKKGKK